MELTIIKTVWKLLAFLLDAGLLIYYGWCLPNFVIEEGDMYKLVKSLGMAIIFAILLVGVVSQSGDCIISHRDNA